MSATIGDKYPERSFFMLFIAITSGACWLRVHGASELPGRGMLPSSFHRESGHAAGSPQGVRLDDTRTLGNGAAAPGNCSTPADICCCLQVPDSPS